MTVPVNSVAEGSCIADIGGNMGFGRGVETTAALICWRNKRNVHDDMCNKTLRRIPAAGRAGSKVEEFLWGGLALIQRGEIDG